MRPDNIATAFANGSWVFANGENTALYEVNPVQTVRGLTHPASIRGERIEARRIADLPEVFNIIEQRKEPGELWLLHAVPKYPDLAAAIAAGDDYAARFMFQIGDSWVLNNAALFGRPRGAAPIEVGMPQAKVDFRGLLGDAAFFVEQFIKWPSDCMAELRAAQRRELQEAGAA